MPLAGNAIDTNALASLSHRAGPKVTAAIQKASAKTGVDFSYMMEKAAAESSFDTNAQAKTSSARGLYQFIESTWLQMVNRYGDKYGLDHYADKISDSGKVTDRATRKHILALRDNPEIAALMAGEFASENKRALVSAGIPESEIGSTELYLAHFMGAGAASEFIKAKNDNPLAPAADIFPAAAKANKNVFYNQKTQEARSFGEIYTFFDNKFTGEKPTAAKEKPEIAVASNTSDNTRIQVDNNTNRMSEHLLALFQNNDWAPSDRIARVVSGSTRNLVSDPVALMLMSRMDHQPSTASAMESDDDRKEENRSHRSEAMKIAMNLNQ